MLQITYVVHTPDKKCQTNVFLQQNHVLQYVIVCTSFGCNASAEFSRLETTLGNRIACERKRVYLSTRCRWFGQVVRQCHSMLSNITYSSNVSDSLDESIERIVSGLLLIQVSSECRIEQHAKVGS